MTRAAVIQTAYLGDAVLTTPLIEVLADRFGSLDVVTTPNAKPIFQTLPTVERVIEFDKRGTHRGLRGMRVVARRLAEGGAEVAFLPHKSVRSALLARLAGIPRRIGFRTSPARWLYTESRDGGEDHEIDRICSLADHVGPPPIPRVQLTSDDVDEARRALDAAQIGTPFIALAPGSQQPTKRWPYFIALAERLSNVVAVVMIGGRQDVGVGARVSPGKYAFTSLAGRLSLRASAEIIRRARVLVSNDSVAMHLAGAMHTKVVALFGPTHPELGFGPRGTADITLGVRHLVCRPCSTHGGPACPLRHHRCMIDLDLETVFQATQKLLTVPQGTHPCA